MKRLEKNTKKLSLVLMLAASTALVGMDAMATEGYFTHGSGARNKAMGGAGVADGRDAAILNLNPAAIVGNGTELTIAVSPFSPTRKFLGAGQVPSFTPNGVFESSEKLFAIPNIAFIKQIDDTSAWGISLSANGGMNTNYRSVTNPTCQFLFNQSPPRAPADNGVYCGGTTGVNLTQALLTAGYSKQFGNFKIGGGPVFAYQLFEATGLQAFTFPSGPNQPAPTVDPAHMTNNGTDKSTGFGAKIGFEYALSPEIRIGGAYHSKINMGKFDLYAGLFADGGDFDIPSSYQIGVSADVTPEISVSMDYRRINYSDAASVSNPQIVIDPANGFPRQFGAANGPGFGWKDVDVFKVGAEWRANDQWTLRAGYAHNSQPVQGENITINVLAPGVVRNHITAGGEFKLNDSQSFEFGLMYAPPEAVKGIELTPQGPNPGHSISAKMNQIEATIGWKMKLGG